MGHKKQHQSQTGKGNVSQMSSKRRSGKRNMAGREFGNLVEPMQAEMASGNEGLAESSGSPRQSRGKGGKRAA